MIKKLFNISLYLLFSISLIAMEKNPGPDIRTIKMAQGIREMVLERVETDESSILKEGIVGGVYGTIAPELLTYLGGAELLKNPDYDARSEKIAGIIATGILLPITLPLSMFTGLIGFSIGCIKGISKEIGAKAYDHAFDEAISKHILQWIMLVKQGRLTIKNELTTHMQKNNEISLKVALTSYLKGEKFRQIFGDNGWDENNLKLMLDDITPENDSWDNLFVSLSEKIKRKDISQENWQKVEQYLIKQKQLLGELNQADIQEYLPFAVYFFSAMDKYGARIFTSFVGSI